VLLLLLTQAWPALCAVVWGNWDLQGARLTHSLQTLFFPLISLAACAIGFPESLAMHNGLSYYPSAFSSEAGK